MHGLQATLVIQSPAVSTTVSQGEPTQGGEPRGKGPTGPKGRTPPLKPPKKYREEDTEVLRCKRRLDFVRLGLAMPRPHPETVAKRNERERKRVKKINSTFATLKSRIPGGLFEEKSEKKRSKVDTLKAAIDYIYNLQELLDEHDAVSAALGGPGATGLGAAGLGATPAPGTDLGAAGLGSPPLRIHTPSETHPAVTLPSPTPRQEPLQYRLTSSQDYLAQHGLSRGLITPGQGLPHTLGLTPGPPPHPLGMVTHTPGSAYSPGSTYSGGSDSSGTESHLHPRADLPYPRAQLPYPRSDLAYPRADSHHPRDPSPPPLSPEEQELLEFAAWF